jgi:creatinine amidohydrolase
LAVCSNTSLNSRGGVDTSDRSTYPSFEESLYVVYQNHGEKEMSKPNKVYWHEHTQSELASILPEVEVVLVPTGSVEIHGPHLGVGNDILSCTQVAEEAAGALYPKAIVANALWLGVAPHNMTAEFPGTITLSAHTYMLVLQEVVESLLKHGVRRVVFINGHGGNEAPNITACREIREQLHYKHGVDMEVGTLSYWEAIPPQVWSDVQEINPNGRIGHGGEAETSILLSVAPQAVRMDLALPPDQRPRPAAPFFRAWYQDEYSPNGHSDDPRVATKEKGEKLVAAAVKGVVEVLEQFFEYKPVGTQANPGRHLYPASPSKT